MAYLLERTDRGGGYVTPSGSPHSFTLDPLQARRFPTREAAEAERCPENERVVSLEEVIR